VDPSGRGALGDGEPSVAICVRYVEAGSDAGDDSELESMLVSAVMSLGDDPRWSRPARCLGFLQRGRPESSMRRDPWL
jgi:hypothetical protein